MLFFSKVAYFFFYRLFLFVNKTLWLNNFKTRADMNAKIPVSVICVEAIIYLLLYNLIDCTFKKCQDLQCECCKSLLLFKEYTFNNVNKTFTLKTPTSCKIVSHTFMLSREMASKNIFAYSALIMGTLRGAICRIFNFSAQSQNFIEGWTGLDLP